MALKTDLPDGTNYGNGVSADYWERQSQGVYGVGTEFIIRTPEALAY